ncbi:MAG: hypothetical protein CVU11_08445 [Bacteroidetes bacterium HGW-Bacteroidetes-6]|jgi:hypothetical protein|nr:MAG: hypothetical protein CVU11_08445 [Bacteroidetes bacterium HGW-Bacteroidetes-6]
MKKPLLSFRIAQSWNRLLRKFFSLFRRIEGLKASGVETSIELNQMQRKLQSIYNRLSKLQRSVGVKIAGSAIALMLMSANLSAQTYVNEGPLSSNYSLPISVGLLSAISTGDIDGDGDIDIVAGEYFGNTAIYYNDGTGIFTSNSPIKIDGIPVSTGYMPSPTLADVDEDGDLDLYIGTLAGTIKVGINDGTGVFTSAPDMLADGVLLDVGTLAFPEFADVDDDGDLDLYVGEQTGLIKVFLNNGSGVFTSAGNMQDGGIDINFAPLPQPVFYDFDNDGDLDLFVGDQSGLIKVYSNNGTGAFTASANLQSSGVDIDPGTYSSPAFIDVDDDGDMDFLSGDYYGKIHVYLNNGSGVLSDASNLEAFETPFAFGQFSAPAFADIDNDGDLDLFVGKYEGTIATLNNNGNGDFALGANLMAAGIELDAGSFAVPEFADIDEDGDMDLYVGNFSGNIVVFENNGSGVFSAGVNLQAGGIDIDAGSIACPEFADLDADGDFDLYVGNNSGTILVFENDGTGSFTAASTPLFEADGATLDVFAYSSPLFCDIDGDSDLDLLVGEYYGKIQVYINNSGVFNASSTNFQADGQDVDIYLLAIPAIANIDGGCGPDLYVGGYMTPVYFYSYKDTIAPTITCPANFTYNLLQYQSNYTVSGSSLDPIYTSDNCNIESVLNNFNGSSTLAGVDFPAGAEMVTWTVTDIDGNTTSCNVDITINVFNAIEDLETMGILVYPNPSSGIFSIENAQNCNILISDAFGKSILSFANVQDAKIDVDLTNRPAGIYFITVSNETIVKTAKIVID